jgi:hypothetical protein
MSTSGLGKGGRPPGLPKTGGRARGTPNRATLALKEKLASLDCDPMVELVKIAREPKTETGTKVGIFSLLLRHSTPLPKPVDESNQNLGIDDESAFTVDEVVKLAKYVLNRFGPNAAPQGETTTQETEGQTNPLDPDKE